MCVVALRQSYRKPTCPCKRSQVKPQVSPMHESFARARQQVHPGFEESANTGNPQGHRCPRGVVHPLWCWHVGHCRRKRRRLIDLCVYPFLCVTKIQLFEWSSSCRAARLSLQCVCPWQFTLCIHQVSGCAFLDKAQQEGCPSRCPESTSVEITCCCRAKPSCPRLCSSMNGVGWL